MTDKNFQCYRREQRITDDVTGAAKNLIEGSRFFNDFESEQRKSEKLGTIVSEDSDNHADGIMKK